MATGDKDPGAVAEYAVAEFLADGATVTIDMLGSVWSEPVRVKPGLRSGLQQIIAFTGAAPFGEQIKYSEWGYPWSEPVRQKRGLYTPLQQFFTSDTKTIAAGSNLSWYQWFATPVRVKQGLPASEQYVSAATMRPPIVTFSYYQPLAMPVWPKKGISVTLQMHKARSQFIANPHNQGYVIF